MNGAEPGGPRAEREEETMTKETHSGDGAGDDYEAPTGTLFLLMVYVMVLAGMWVTMYLLLVTR